MDLTRYISRECCRSARAITTAVLKFILGVSKVDSTEGCIALISDEEALLVVGALMPSLWNVACRYMARAKSAHHQNVQAEKDPTRLARAAEIRCPSQRLSQPASQTKNPGMCYTAFPYSLHWRLNFVGSVTPVSR